jgi:chromosome segregation and condensation protein ScpB
VQRHGDELRLVTAPEVSKSVERHVNKPKQVGLSKAALEVVRRQNVRRAQAARS